MVETLPVNAGDIRDSDIIPRSEDLLEEGIRTHSSIFARRIPWTEEPGRLLSIGLKESDATEVT